MSQAFEANPSAGPRGFGTPHGGSRGPDPARRYRVRIARSRARGPRLSVLVAMLVLFIGGAGLLPQGLTASPPAAARSVPAAPPAPSAPDLRVAVAGVAGALEAAVRRAPQREIRIDLTARVLPPAPAAAFPDDLLPTPVIEARLAEAASRLAAADAAVFDARRHLAGVRRLVGAGSDPQGRLAAARAALAAGEAEVLRAEAAWSVPAAQLEARRRELLHDLQGRAGAPGRTP